MTGIAAILSSSRGAGIQVLPPDTRCVIQVTEALRRRDYAARVID
jgi:hypothetical protein